MSTTARGLNDPVHQRQCGRMSSGRASGFTLIEVVLVVVISLIMLSVSLPQFSRTFKGSKIRSAARTINRMARYARSMAILRETTMTIVMNGESGEIYLGGPALTTTNAADGELDQAVLKRLGYVEGDGSPESLGIEKEVHRYLPEGIEITDFEKESIDKDAQSDYLYLVQYFADGRSEWFSLILEGRRNVRVEMENDPISGTLRADFTQ